MSSSCFGHTKKFLLSEPEAVSVNYQYQNKWPLKGDEGLCKHGRSVHYTLIYI